MYADSETVGANATGGGNGTHAPAALLVSDTDPARAREELRMLLVGFGTGLFIAFIFLTYIALAFSNVLP